jgi:hypothetical protein
MPRKLITAKNGTVEAIWVDKATPADFSEFLAGTSWSYTDEFSGQGILGSVKLDGPYGRHMDFTAGEFAVKVDGEFHGIYNGYGFKKLCDQE